MHQYEVAPLVTESLPPGLPPWEMLHRRVLFAYCVAAPLTVLTMGLCSRPKASEMQPTSEQWVYMQLSQLEAMIYFYGKTIGQNPAGRSLHCRLIIEMLSRLIAFKQTPHQQGDVEMDDQFFRMMKAVLRIDDPQEFIRGMDDTNILKMKNIMNDAQRFIDEAEKIAPQQNAPQLQPRQRESYDLVNTPPLPSESAPSASSVEACHFHRVSARRQLLHSLDSSRS